MHSNFSSPSVLLPPAMATGRLTIITDAMAREVTVNAQGLATGVAYIDKKTGRENHVQARIVVLAASACESARIMLNSKSSQFPQGHRQLQRRGRQIHHGQHRRQRLRVRAAVDGSDSAQRRRRRRRAPLHAVGARQQQARLPARVSHRNRRRHGHAGLGLRRQHPAVQRLSTTAARSAATARASRRTTGSSMAPRSTWPAAAR